ncbi:MAG: amino acid-binding protein [Lachnospiraceae bacterium]|nr:amino acid-binding protein [Lachnospiraceae bacterium]
MFVKQLSVFLENREGRLEEALRILKDNDINIISLSLADTSDFGLLRLIVNDPVKAKQVLKESRFSSQVGDIIAIRISHTVGSLSEVLGAVTEADINIEYMYTLSVGVEGASLALKTSDLDRTVEVISGKNVHIYTQEELG